MWFEKSLNFLPVPVRFTFCDQHSSANTCLQQTCGFIFVRDLWLAYWFQKKKMKSEAKMIIFKTKQSQEDQQIARGQFGLQDEISAIP